MHYLYFSNSFVKLLHFSYSMYLKLRLINILQVQLELSSHDAATSERIIHALVHLTQKKDCYL